MDMAKVGNPLSVVSVFAQIWTSHVHSQYFSLPLTMENHNFQWENPL